MDECLPLLWCTSRSGLLDRQIEARIVLLETALPSKAAVPSCLPIDSDSELLLLVSSPVEALLSVLWILPILIGV